MFFSGLEIKGASSKDDKQKASAATAKSASAASLVSTSTSGYHQPKPPATNYYDNITQYDDNNYEKCSSVGNNTFSSINVAPTKPKHHNTTSNKIVVKQYELYAVFPPKKSSRESVFPSNNNLRSQFC
jgi:hypothetical protein